MSKPATPLDTIPTRYRRVLRVVGIVTVLLALAVGFAIHEHQRQECSRTGGQWTTAHDPRARSYSCDRPTPDR